VESHQKPFSNGTTRREKTKKKMKINATRGFPSKERVNLACDYMSMPPPYIYLLIITLSNEFIFFLAIIFF